MTTLNDSLVGTVIDERFRVTAFLGAGGMGTAFLAEQVDLRRSVCIKFLNVDALSDTENLARFKREARVLAQLQHPNIAACYAYGSYQNTYPYLALEYIDGQSLRQLSTENTMDWQRVCRLMIQVCRGLTYAHSYKFIHRDIKPDNVMLCTIGGDETAKIIDFGLVGKQQGSAANLDTITAPGLILGSANYMPPESFAGGTSDQTTDIYALGCTLYELLSGQVPFAGDTIMAVAYLHTNSRLPPLPLNVAPEATRKSLEAIIWKATEAKAGGRFASCDEIAECLQHVLACNSDTISIAMPDTAPKQRSLLNAKVILCSTVALLAGIGVFCYLTNNHNIGGAIRLFGITDDANSGQDLVNFKKQVDGLTAEWSANSNVSRDLIYRTGSQLDSLAETFGKPAECNSLEPGAASYLKNAANALSQLNTLTLRQGANYTSRIVDLQCDLFTAFRFYRLTLAVLKRGEPILLKDTPISNGTLELRELHEYVAQNCEQSTNPGRMVQRLLPAAMEYKKFADQGRQFRWLLSNCGKYQIKQEFRPSLAEIATSIRTPSKSDDIQLLIALADMELDLQNQSAAVEILNRARTLCANCSDYATVELLARTLAKADQNEAACDVLRSNRTFSAYEFCKLRGCLVEIILKHEQTGAKRELAKTVDSKEFRSLIGDPAADQQKVFDVLTMIGRLFERTSNDDSASKYFGDAWTLSLQASDKTLRDHIIGPYFAVLKRLHKHKLIRTLIARDYVLLKSENRLAETILSRAALYRENGLPQESIELLSNFLDPLSQQKVASLSGVQLEAVLELSTVLELQGQHGRFLEMTNWIKGNPNVSYDRRLELLQSIALSDTKLGRTDALIANCRQIVELVSARPVMSAADNWALVSSLNLLSQFSTRKENLLDTIGPGKSLLFNGSILVWRAETEWKERRAASARLLATRGEELLGRLTGNEVKLARSLAYLHLSALWYDLCSTTKAFTIADLAIKQLQDEHRNHEAMNWLCAEADWSLAQGDVDRAEGFISKALLIEVPQTVRANLVYPHWSPILVERKEFDRALKLLEEARYLARKTTNRRMHRAQLTGLELNLAFLRSRQRSFKDESHHYHNILEMCEPNDTRRISAMIGLARIAEIQSNLPECFKLLQESVATADSLEFRKACGDGSAQANKDSLLLHLAAACLRCGDQTNAGRYLRECKTELVLRSSLYLAQLAESEFLLGQNTLAEQHFRDALAVVDELPSEDPQARRKRISVYLPYACWLHGVNRQDEARKYADKAWSLLQLQSRFLEGERSVVLRNLRRLHTWYIPNDEKKFQSIEESLAKTELRWGTT